MQNKQQTLDEWSAYWRDGRGAACRSDDLGLYRGAIGEWWTACFRTLPERARVVDLATGNGAVIELGLKALAENGRCADFYGVDRAVIMPRLTAAGSANVGKLRFLSQVSNESLPFATAMFDYLSSQFGVEYGDLQQTVKETKRVLKPQAGFSWVCHWREGDIARAAAVEAGDIEYFESLQLPVRMVDLIKLQLRAGAFIADSHRLTASSRQRQRLQEGLNLAFERLRQRGHAPDSNLHLYLKNLAHLYQYREQQEPRLVLEKLHECGQELLFHGRRLRALVDAALTTTRVEAIISMFKQEGMQVLKHGVLSESREHKDVAYFFRAQK